MKLEFEIRRSCYLCGAERYRNEFRREFFGQSFTWVRCQGCGLVYQNPKPTRNSLCEVYNSLNYWGQHDSEAAGYHDYLGIGAKRQAQARQRAQLLHQFLDHPGKVLEVGCAAGFFLDAISEIGHLPVGVELSQGMGNYARRRYGHRVIIGDIETADLGADPFQAVAAWGLDSNFYDPDRSFGRMASVLAPGGYLLFNFFDWDHWFRPFLGEFKKVYNALYYLNRNHVLQLLDRHRLELCRLATESHYTTIAEICHHTGRTRLLRLVRRMGLANLAFRLPIPGSFLVVARKT